MYLEQRPDTLADIASSHGLDGALGSMFQQAFHLGAIGRWTFG